MFTFDKYHTSVWNHLKELGRNDCPTDLFKNWKGFIRISFLKPLPKREGLSLRGRVISLFQPFLPSLQ